MISREDYITASGKYPERLKSTELTLEVEANIKRLLLVVNSLLKELGIVGAVVSSGFRPSAVNAQIKNSAKKSAHMVGLAIDIVGVDLAKLLLKKPELLKKHGLWLEHPDYTKTWTHLDLISRSARKIQVFIPA